MSEEKEPNEVALPPEFQKMVDEAVERMKKEQHAMLDGLAKAWDEGVTHAHGQGRYMSLETNLTKNPYRSAKEFL